VVIVISLSLLLLGGERNVIRGLLSEINKVISANLPYQYTGLLEQRTPTIESLIPKIIMTESSNNPNAVNERTGAKGLMQIMDKTAEDPGFGVKPLKDPFDPVENVRFGTEYLNAMMKKYDNNIVNSLAAYNMGPGKTDKWLDAGGKFDELPKETQNYINKIVN
jgi:soluble lytic murein transglycosylase-like protein